MSKLEVDAIEPQSGTTLTLGASGDTVNIASGATITDFTSTGIDDNATSTAITIDSSENVGIGTTSPDALLDVENSTTPKIRVGDGTRHVEIHGGSTTQNPAIGTYYAGSMRFTTNSTERMTIDTDGKVGIGTTPSGGSLHIASNAGGGGGKIRFGFGGFDIDTGYVTTGDMDNYKTSGFYRFDAAVSNTPTSHIYATVVFGNGSNVVTQIATRLASTITYVRSFNNSWTSWARLDT